MIEKTPKNLIISKSFMSKKYISIYRFYYTYIKWVFIVLILIDINKASGAYDKGTSTGKGRFELSITFNPMGIVPYGQNYSVLSYGLSSSFDIVGYYSYHKNGTISQYLGTLYQFYNSKNLDLATAFGIRHKDKGEIDIFAPQLLYNYHLNDGYSIGGSIVRVIENETFNNNGTAIDITIYKRMNSLINNKIKDAYIGFGFFKNSAADLSKDKLYLHYSLDFIF
tara:strand:- start:2557 stop:3228 length:672 start_codon:yes stop_codon:yes gene_type:complete